MKKLYITSTIAKPEAPQHQKTNKVLNDESNNQTNK